MAVKTERGLRNENQRYRPHKSGQALQKLILFRTLPNILAFLFNLNQSATVLLHLE
jgi:hypothetical protein